MVSMDTNFTEAYGEVTESLEELNKRYATALVPIAVWLGLLAVLGIFGNLLVIVVFSISLEYRNTNFKVFVLCLATVDLLTCVTLMPAEIVKTRHYFYFDNGAPCKVKCFFNLFSQIASALVFLIICVDRFRKVCMPLKRQIWPGLATRLVVVIVLVSLLLSIPGPFLCGISNATTTNVHGTNTTVFFCAAEEDYRNSVLRKLYKIGLTVSFCGMSIAFIVMYALILKTIIKHRRNLSRGSSIQFNISTKSSKSKCELKEKQHVAEYEATDPMLNDGQTGGGNRGMTSTAGQTGGGNRDMSSTAGQTGGENRGISSTAGQTGGVNRDVSSTAGQTGGGNCGVSSIASQNGGGNRGVSSIAGQESYKTKYSLKKSVSLVTNSQYQLRNYSVRRRLLSATNWRIPYKTAIWILLTFVFMLTYIVHAVLSFTRTNLYTLCPNKLSWFLFFFRIYFVNNVVNPIVYICLDKRFKVSCHHLISLIKR